MGTEQKIIKIVDSVTPTIEATVEQIGSQGALITKSVGLPVPNGYDYIGVGGSGAVEIYTYKSGGASGTTLRIVTVTYTDSGKETLSSVAYTDV